MHRFCPVAALKRQLHVLGADMTSDVLLFQRCSNNGARFLGGAVEYATFRGAAACISLLLKRHLTFRACSRNVVFTKLANDHETSDFDKAAFMGVTTKTIGVYLPKF